MKTDELIALMASGVTPVDRDLPRRQMAGALALGTLGALILMLLVYGLRPDLGLMLGVPLFWIKLAFPTAMTVGSMLVLRRLLRPGLEVGARWAGIALPGLVLWAGGVLVLLSAPAAQRLPLLMGLSWRSCPFNIALLSVPLFIGIFWAVRAMAPTRLRLTGAVAGLLAGACATMVYCLHCPEMGVPFWGLWYCLGMLVPTLAGVLLGPRLLRW